MPISQYFNKPGNNKPGEGSKVLSSMESRYGSSKGKRVFYATVNRMRKGSPAERAAQPVAPRRAAKDSTTQTAAKRLRKQAMTRGNQQRAHVESKHPFQNQGNGGPIGYQPNSH